MNRCANSRSLLSVSRRPKAIGTNRQLCELVSHGYIEIALHRAIEIKKLDISGLLCMCLAGKLAARSNPLPGCAQLGVSYCGHGHER